MRAGRGGGGERIGAATRPACSQGGGDARAGPPCDARAREPPPDAHVVLSVELMQHVEDSRDPGLRSRRRHIACNAAQRAWPNCVQMWTTLSSCLDLILWI